VTDYNSSTVTEVVTAAIDDHGRSWVEVMPTAEQARNGAYFFSVDRDDLETFAQSIRAKGDRTPVDYDHDGARPEGSTRAAGWFTGAARVDDTPDGPRLVAEVAWTPPAAAAIRAGEYRYLSPEFTFQEKDPRTGLMRRARELVAASLTNRPFWKQLAAVTAAAEDELRALPALSMPIPPRTRGSMMSTTAIGQDVHDKALEIIARRNEVRGVAPDEYGAAIYTRALDEAKNIVTAASREVEDRIRAALDELGLELPDAIDVGLVDERARELMREKGLLDPISWPDYRAAVRQAVREIVRDWRSQILTAASEGKEIPPEQEIFLAAMFDTDPEKALRLLASQRPSERALERIRAKERDLGGEVRALVDIDDPDFDLAAEEVLATDRASEHPVTAAMTPERAYFWALGEVEERALEAFRTAKRGEAA
jgi:hypothetical protein